MGWWTEKVPNHVMSRSSAVSGRPCKFTAKGAERLAKLEKRHGRCDVVKWYETGEYDRRRKGRGR